MTLALPEYAAKTLYIVDKAGKRIPLVFNAAQQRLHARVEQAKREHPQHRVRIISLKARRLGLSTYYAARAYHRAANVPNTNVRVLAHRDSSVRELFTITEYFHSQQPRPYKPPKRAHARATELLLDDPRNQGVLNSRYKVELAGQDIRAADAVARSATLHVAHCSEVGYWAQPTATMGGLLAALEGDGTEVYVESTANGQAGWFYENWIGALEDPYSDWEPIFLPWWIDTANQVDCPSEQARHIRDTMDDDERRMLVDGIPYEGKLWLLSMEQLAWRRRMIATSFRNNVLLFHQEYPTVPEEAFIASGSCFFDLPTLADRETEARKEEAKRYRVELDGTVGARMDLRGETLIWKHPEKGHDYVIGADACYGRGSLAGITSEEDGSTSHDANAAYVVDIDTMEQVAAYHSYADPDIHADDLWCLGMYYNEALVGPESNGPGQAVLDALRRDKPGVRPAYRRILMQPSIRAQARTPQHSYGWTTTEANRYAMLGGLKSKLRSGELKVNDLSFFREARSFLNITAVSGTVKPQAAVGAHDDRVMALGITTWLAEHFRTRAKLRDEADPLDPKVLLNTGGWRRFTTPGASMVR